MTAKPWSEIKHKPRKEGESITVPDPTTRRKIIRNRARCKECGDVIESTHVHDFVRCTCHAIFVDGGREYVRRGMVGDALEVLTEYAPEGTV